jgi:nitroreductase
MIAPGQQRQDSDMRTIKGPLGFVKSLWRILGGKPQIPPSLAENPALATILHRRSIRRFADKEIPEDVFAAILEAGRLAPSTVNLQTWSLAVFDANSWRETFGRPVPFAATRAVMVLGDTHRARQALDAFPQSPMVEYTIAVMNASLAAMNMNIAAEVLGVSSVMLSETGRSGFLDAGYLKEKLGLPDRVFPILTLVFGYAQGAYPPMPPKLPLETICFEGRYREAEDGRMEDWLAQMKAGYKASHLRSSFNVQLRAYIAKLDRAETTLQRMVFDDRGT